MSKSNLVLPYNSDVEEVVLGIMILDKDKRNTGLIELKEEDFYKDNIQHRYIFRAMKELSNNYEPIEENGVAVIDYLNRVKLLSCIGSIEDGYNYIAKMIDKVTDFSNFASYVETLRYYTLMRKIISCVDEIKDEAVNKPVESFSNFARDVESRISAITNERKVRGFQSIAGIADEVGTELSESFSGRSFKNEAISCGYQYLDNILNGLQRGNLIVLAARPSVGKTALGLNISYNAAKAGNPVGFFSCEMSANSIARRLFSNVSYVTMDDITKGRFTNTDKIKIREAQEEIKKAQLYIDETGSPELEDILSKARKLKNDVPNLSLIVVDYIGKVRVKGLRTDSKVLEIDRVTGALKGLAMELKIPVLALAQVSRHVEDREGGRPALSDLRDSGSIEQDADQVIFLYNKKQAVSNIKNKKNSNPQPGSINAQQDIPNEVIGDDTQNGEPVEIIVAKNRNGKTQSTYLLFFKQYQNFSTPSKETLDYLFKYNSRDD